MKKQKEVQSPVEDEFFDEDLQSMIRFYDMSHSVSRAPWYERLWDCVSYVVTCAVDLVRQFLDTWRCV